MYHKLYKTVMADVCCLCDTYESTGLDLCHACHNCLPYNHFCCYVCAAPLSARTDNRAQICGRCIARPGEIDHSIIPYTYRPPIDFMIKRLKFSAQLKYSRLLGELLADAIERYYANPDLPNPDETLAIFPDLILPVPTHKQRRLQRGFNQAEQIANTVADRYKSKCATDVIIRTVSSQPQSSLSAARREANIRQTYEIANPEDVDGMHVAVVDDVYTTGATARAVSRKLKSAGATRVSIWAVARTP